MTTAGAVEFRRVEEHMGTVVSLLGNGIDDGVADDFFARIRQVEDVLSRFRDHSDVSRLARGETDIDYVDPAVRMVLLECGRLRDLTAGDFDHRPRPAVPPVLDVDAFAKGWIIDDAATVLRMSASDFLVNAGGDITASPRSDGAPWRVGIQHPTVRDAILGTFEVRRGAVATSGRYERGDHIRTTGDGELVSVTVVGPDLGEADGLSTAVFASGRTPPMWWPEVSPEYGLLTVTSDGGVRWLAPAAGGDVEWRFPVES